MEKQLIVGDSLSSKKDVIEITNNLCKENPGMTVEEYLVKLNKNKVHLV